MTQNSQIIQIQLDEAIHHLFAKKASKTNSTEWIQRLLTLSTQFDLENHKTHIRNLLQTEKRLQNEQNLAELSSINKEIKRWQENQIILITLQVIQQNHNKIVILSGLNKNMVEFFVKN